MSNKHGLTCPFIVQDNMTRKTHTVTEVTDTANGRWYWIEGKSYRASMYSILGDTAVRAEGVNYQSGFASLAA